MWIVYALIDPRDRSCRYIGVTDNLERRMREHLRIRPATRLSRVKSGQPKIVKNSRSEKELWIEELKLLGVEPVPVKLATFHTKQKAYRVEEVLINTCSPRLKRDQFIYPRRSIRPKKDCNSLQLWLLPEDSDNV